MSAPVRAARQTLVVPVFDTISGLPLHALVVHAVVVLLPLMCLVTIAVAVRPAWRRHALIVLGLNVLLAVAAFTAKESGERLRARISQFNGGSPEVATHAEWGDRLPTWALAMVVVAAIMVVTRNRAKLAPYAAVLALAGGLVTIGVTVVVGDTGARAVWGQTISNTKAP